MPDEIRPYVVFSFIAFMLTGVRPAPHLLVVRACPVSRRHSAFLPYYSEVHG